MVGLDGLEGLGLKVSAQVAVISVRFRFQVFVFGV